LPALVGQRQQTAAPVLRIDQNRQQTASLKRLQVRGQGRAIHREQRRDRPDRWRVRTIERHEQRELAAGEAEGAEGLVEPPRQCPRRPLRVQAEAVIAHQQGGFERDRQER
jgi:hypothetical protein